MIRTLIICSILSASIFPLNGQNNVDVFGQYLPMVFETEEHTLKYRVMYPHDFDKSKKYPLVLFLHGRGECGDDNERQLIHGSRLFQDSLHQYPAIVLFPQCPVDDFWAKVVRPEAGGSNRKFEFATEGTPNPSLHSVMLLVDTLLAKSYVDNDRFYVSGLSMGGMGTFELLWRMSDKIAAGMPICGGGAPLKAAEIGTIPVWAFHGVKDDVVPARLSIRMVEAIQKAGGRAKISLYPQANHNSWDAAFAEPNYLKWMFSKSRN